MLKPITKTGFTLTELLIVIAIIAILISILFPVMMSAREKARQAACASNIKQIGLAILQYVQDSDEVFPIDNALPQNPHGAWYWTNLIYPYVQNTAVFNCPSFDGINHVANGYAPPPDIGDRLDYGINVSLVSTDACDFAQCAQPISKVNFPSETCLIGDDQGDGHPGENIGWNGSIGSAGFGHCGWPNLWYSTTDPAPGAPGPTSWTGPDCRHLGRATICFCDGHAATLGYNTLYYPPVGVAPANFRLWHLDAQ